MIGFLPIAAMVLAASPAKSFNVTVNGEAVQFGGTGPTEIRGRLLVPVRGIFEALGATVNYDRRTRAIAIHKDDIAIRLVAGQKLATVGQDEMVLDVPAREIHGSTMVPLRVVGETLGADVQWDAASSTVSISTTKLP
jgi:hypothetical protein